jgi:urocanate hydratase
MGGVARRAWARNPHALETCEAYNEGHPELGRIMLPQPLDPGLVARTLGKA